MAYQPGQDPTITAGGPRSDERLEIDVVGQIAMFNDAFERGDRRGVWQSGYDLLGLHTPDIVPEPTAHSFDPAVRVMEVDRAELFTEAGQPFDPISFTDRMIVLNDDDLLIRETMLRDSLQVLGRGLFHNRAPFDPELVSDVRDDQGFVVLDRDMQVRVYSETSTDPDEIANWNETVYDELTDAGYTLSMRGESPLGKFLRENHQIPGAVRALAFLNGTPSETVARGADTEPIPVFIERGDEPAVDTVGFVAASTTVELGTAEEPLRQPERHEIGADLTALLARTPDEWVAHVRGAIRHKPATDRPVAEIPEALQVRRARRRGEGYAVPAAHVGHRVVAAAAETTASAPEPNAASAQSAPETGLPVRDPKRSGFAPGQARTAARNAGLPVRDPQQSGFKPSAS